MSPVEPELDPKPMVLPALDDLPAWRHAFIPDECLSDDFGCRFEPRRRFAQDRSLYPHTETETNGND